MKIAFTTSGENLESALDQRFGRAPKFLIYDTEQKSFTVFDNNQNMDLAQGAGIQSAEAVARSGAESLVTGNCGPKAFKVLSMAGIKVYNTTAKTISEALQQLQAGLLKPLEDANVASHWI